MIAWVDVETTGLDPKGGSLLEVGMILTDDDLGEVARKALVVAAPPVLRLTLKPEVLGMHEESGLLAECEGRSAPNRDEVMFAFCRWLNDRVAEPPTMAGNTVGFDRSWLKAKMSILEQQFHYRSIDVSSLKELNERWNFAPKWTGDRKFHRSLLDLEDSIAELAHYRTSLGLAHV